MNTSSTRTRKGRRLLALLVALAAAVGLTLGAAGSASAYYDPGYGGSTARVQMGTVYGSANVVRPGFVVDTPVAFAYHNSAISYSQQQDVGYTVALQRWVPASRAWVNDTWYAGWGLTEIGADGKVMIPSVHLVGVSRIAGYYRVLTTIQWNGVSALPYRSTYATGWRQIAPSELADMVCASTACVAYRGSTYISG